MYIYICIYICTYIYVYICKYVNTYALIYVYLCIYKYIGVLQIVHGSNDTVNFLCDSPVVKAISFVGKWTRIAPSP
jgi:acyl-CoA reductase-like NAD-dependent aldehyde dehydrogenase